MEMHVDEASWGLPQLVAPEVFRAFPRERETPLWLLYLFALAYMSDDKGLEVSEAVIQALRLLQRQGRVPATTRLQLRAKAAGEYIRSREGRARCHRTRKRWRLLLTRETAAALAVGKDMAGGDGFISEGQAYESVGALRMQHLGEFEKKLRRQPLDVDLRLRLARERHESTRTRYDYVDKRRAANKADLCPHEDLDDNTFLTKKEDDPRQRRPKKQQQTPPRFVKLWRATRSSPTALLPFHGTPSMALVVLEREKKQQQQNRKMIRYSKSSSSLKKKKKASSRDDHTHPESTKTATQIKGKTFLPPPPNLSVATIHIPLFTDDDDHGR